MAKENNNAQRPSSKFDFRKPTPNKFDFRKEEDEESETGEGRRKKSGRVIAVAAITAMICAGIAAFAWHNSQNVSETCESSAEHETQVAQTTEGQANTPCSAAGNQEVATLECQQGTASEDNAPEVNGNTSDKAAQATIEQGEKSEPVASETTAAESASSQKESAPRRDALSNSAANAGSDMADVEKMAILVIRGNYGNGERRKVMLAERYTAIQNRVNEIYREKEGR